MVAAAAIDLHEVGLRKVPGASELLVREYSSRDDERLRRIVTFRKTGATMREIRRMIDGGTGNLHGALEERLEQLNAEIAALREQQRFILGLLKCRRVTSRVGVMNLNLWVSLLKASGFGQEDMNRWHSAFERSSPASHQKFLEFLCLPEKEIARIRKASRERDPGPRPDGEPWTAASALPMLKIHVGCSGSDPDPTADGVRGDPGRARRRSAHPNG